MHLGLGKNVYISCAIWVLAISFFAKDVSARPQDQPAKNPDAVTDPYTDLQPQTSVDPGAPGDLAAPVDASSSDQAPEVITPTVPKASTQVPPEMQNDPISESAIGTAPAPAVPRPTEPPAVPDSVAAAERQETTTELSQDDSIVRNSNGEIIEIESYPEDVVNGEKKSMMNGWSRSYRDRRSG